MQQPDFDATAYLAVLKEQRNSALDAVAHLTAVIAAKDKEIALLKAGQVEDAATA